jgi:hypothetical protein
MPDALALPVSGRAAVRLFDSRLSRPKVAVETATGPPYAYRVHAPVDVDALAAEPPYRSASDAASTSTG